MSAGLIWLIAAVVLAGAEALTGTLFLLMLGGGALAAAVSSWLVGGPAWVGGGVFLAMSVLLLTVVRPGLRRRLPPAAGMLTGVDALEGQSALVLDRVASDQGQVKLGGQVWTARPLNDTDVYQPGERVTVMHIDGATAVVWRST
ncbi:NfeD family protein [Mycobacterium sp.]|uniref:NfeD family protein n=1 Tax=Mycobacterium sp. TaxID=1785 RepID=UPI00127A64CD|nr:NfeD family protein [Mycobacterium sp.]KAA8969125.1 MAG: NfeD family protein [Mycobacterium sp.]